MGLRFRRRIRILPGVRLNVSRSGVSTSMGRRGMWVTYGKRGTRTTVGLPGTGLSYTTTLTKPNSAAPAGPAGASAQPPARVSAWWWIALAVGAGALWHFLGTR